jgi:hypothetical protein
MKNSICKIVYFDEDSVTDYVQIIAGGELEHTTELLQQSEKNAEGKTETKVSAGISKVFKALVGLEAQASAEASMGASLNTSKMAKNIVKNTILTDFLNIIDEDSEKKKGGKLPKGTIKKFQGYKITVEKDSLSYIVMVSPYLSMLKSGSGIPAGEFKLSIDKMESALKNAKGYYEFIGTRGRSQVILRFNINALKNNYKINDLLKMNLSIYAIKVGTTSLDKLNINKELDIDVTPIVKDNPEYVDEDILEVSDELKNKNLDVYDVLLAGIEIND